MIGHKLTFSMLLAFAILLLSSLAKADQIVSSVDRDTLGIQETFTLTVSADSKATGQPDFSLLKNDFEILSNNVSQFTSISNAGAEYKKVWQLMLAPKRVGTLLIPSFNIDGAVSDAIQISVSKQNQSQSSGDDPVTVTVDVDKENVFVQEQILVNVKLISQVNLSQAEMEPLSIKDAVVIPLSEKPKQYISTINGKKHLVLESSYAIFPQNSGDFILPSLIYTVVPSMDRDLWSDPFGRNRNNVLRLPTEEKHIKVSAVPTSATGLSWQPASNLTLNETWSSSLEQLKVGEPITRTITISTTGLTGGQIAPLTQSNIDGLTFYPDQPQTKDIKTEKGIEGTRIETMAIVPNRGGDFTLPEIAVDWWDTASQTMRSAKLPAKKIHVLGATNLSPEPASQNQNTATDPDNETLQPNALNEEHKIPSFIWIVIALLAFSCLSLLLYVLKLRSQLAAINREQAQADHILSEKEKDIWDFLKHAASNRDASSLRKAVLNWAKFYWPDLPIHSLDDVSALCKNAELTSALRKIDELLYSNHPDSDWDPDQLLKRLHDCRKQRLRGKQLDSLRPLYKS